MTLGEFTQNYIEHNSLVRLLYKEPGGHRVVLNDWNDVDMDHQIVKGIGKYAPYINHRVLGLASILVRGHYPEAINVVIEEIPLDILRAGKLDCIII